MDADCIREFASPQELGAILAGLRALEAINTANLNLKTFEGIKDVATGGGEFKALTPEEIDDLCIRINTGRL